MSKVKQDEYLWNRLGEYRIKVKLGHKAPTKYQVEQARAIYKVDLLEDVLLPEDKIIEEIDLQKLSMMGLGSLDIKAFYVISKVPKVHSVILNKDIYVYWDSVSSHDVSAGKGYHQMLEQNRLLKKPNENTPAEELDNAMHRRVWTLVLIL